MKGLKDKDPQLCLKCHGWPGQRIGDRSDSFIATCVLLQSSVISGVWYHDMQGEEDYLPKPQSQRVSGRVFSPGRESGKLSLQKLICAIIVSQEFRATTSLQTDLGNSRLVPLSAQWLQTLQKNVFFHLSEISLLLQVNFRLLFSYTQRLLVTAKVNRHFDVDFNKCMFEYPLHMLLCFFFIKV